ncbi:MAG: T9SS type A sorting domain-containing protein [Candidatus Cloacimonadaceae bacterium]|jgi:hypothetical protein|nr:T9SS type A sorting domain-containing protein [Candidatus Cloacimonadota bacterium]MCB5255588.1 T9SS type A sorting domain-containing protein [Candidatus Cloacimonadota bacterium]MCK9177416.1 T9SS type A sorting domain-containing protein [Candidatus Cloacimonadota bacterium]MCK9241694.1 T9SS type A sorting domain-containing protein [Candidatus Cloacimonadota bacterium]MDY0126695.1 T9SS type A sorting domain-containing protein [Candidatus Cloacimonadaceae bacterium]
MKRFSIFIFSILCISSFAAIEVSGVQSGTWSADNNPYQIIGEVTVPVGEVLTIQPGVIVQAMGNYRIRGEGTIQAVGTETDSIYFLNGQTPPTNYWKGIRLENETQQSNLMHIVMEYAEYPIFASNSPMEVSYSRFSYGERGLQLYSPGEANPATMNVHHNIIEHVTRSGITITNNSNAWVHHNELRYNGTGRQYYAAIQLSNQSSEGINNPLIEHNHIHDNLKQGISAWDVANAYAINPIIRYNHIEGNLTGIYLLQASGVVHDNLIINNFISGDANSGAGMMISGVTSTPYVAGNTLTGNFTGFYITNNALPVLGDFSDDHEFAYGGNIIQNNIDESNTLHSIACADYPNSNNVIMAENNDWGVYTAAEIAIGITDHNDNPALPTVDFEPWFEPIESITITGSYSWNSEDYDEILPEDLELYLVDSETRETLEVHELTANPFSFETEISANVFVLLRADDYDAGIWATVGTLTEPTAFDLAAGDDVDLGNIYIEAWQHYFMQRTGDSELIEGREVWPIYKSLLFLAYDEIDYVYEEGDYLYIYKHEYLDDEGWHEILFDWGQQYDRIGVIEHGEQWNQTSVVEGQIVHKELCSFVDQDGRIMIRSAFPDGGVITGQRFIDSESDIIYLYDESGYSDLYLDMVQTANDGLYLYHRPNLTHPSEMSMRIAEEFPEQTYAIHFWWQAPADDGVDYNAYRIYEQHSPDNIVLLGTVSFDDGPEYYADFVTGSGPVQFWVVATDGEIESEPSNTVEFDFPISNEDLVLQPSLNIYPNPVCFRGGHSLQVVTKGFDQAELSIYNIRGQKVISQKLGKENYSWNGRDRNGEIVGSGIYLMRVKGAGKRSFSRKIMVIK